MVVNSVNPLEQNSVAEVKKPSEETTVKLSDLNVPLSSIRPSPSIPPLTLPIESAAETGGQIFVTQYGVCKILQKFMFYQQLTPKIQLNSVYGTSIL